ncbi:Nucleotide-binding universal stress protein, UspA family [Saccharopolyspora shandongensis]|uniref:Nucleotide-binding universal stress protein, UspA family n=1 Tax=Saccharopolyspora shandongensis TaxID=418495 RepID=A0A1H3E9R1_9PSEU|nr:Nucleotide-binding universal stress protein, UspA family [Saccharopolyspora shandongensis]
MRCVLAGVDGSTEAATAALWAAGEAALRGAPLRLVAVVAGGDNSQARDIVRDAGEWCRREHREIDVAEEVVRGFPPAELVRESVDAQLVVVGSRGRGAVAETLLGSVSRAVAERASCPAVVVPRCRTSFALGPVVLGVADPPLGAAAVAFAFAEAALRSTSLLAVHVWRPVAGRHSRIEAETRATRSAVDDVRSGLAVDLAGWTTKYPDVQPGLDVRYGEPAGELCRAASSAQLLVLGHRGTVFGFGSVAHGVLHRADCPVVIVGETHHGEDVVFFDERRRADEGQDRQDADSAP